jgi:hypothetical protein
VLDNGVEVALGLFQDGLYLPEPGQHILERPVEVGKRPAGRTGTITL